MKKVTVFLLSFFLLVAAKAQKTLVKDANTLKVISSLVDKTYAEAESILKSNGLKFYKKEKDGDSRLDNYFFVPKKAADPDYEPDYTIGCRGNKVVAVMVSYDYEEGEEKTVLKTDKEEIIKQLKVAGFARTEKKGNSDLELFKKNNNTVCIYTDLNIATFKLMIGETKFVEQSLE